MAGKKKIPGGSQYQTLRRSRVDAGFVSSPGGRPGVHSSPRSLANFVELGAQACFFFPLLNESVSFICFLIFNGILCPSALEEGQELRLHAEGSLVMLLLLNTPDCVCAFVSFATPLCVFLARGAGSVRQAFLNGAPKIIRKFAACIENQGISPSPRVQVLSGFLLKRCSGIRNGRGALSLLSFLRAPFAPILGAMESRCGGRSCSILGRADRNTA